MNIIKSIGNRIKIGKGFDYNDINLRAALGGSSYREVNGRGGLILNGFDLQSMMGQTKDGSYAIAPTERPVYFLNGIDRAILARRCAPVCAVITARMQKISALEWKITPKKKEEDRIAETLKFNRDIFFEFKNYNELNFNMVKENLLNEIRREFPEILPDLSNFEGCLKRWKMRLDWQRQDKVNEINDWIQRPFEDEKFPEVTKKITFDWMVHSAAAIYKHFDGGDLKYYSLLPGGSIIKMKTKYASNLPGHTGYIQVTDGRINSQIMYHDELSYMEGLPITMWNINLIPLEALMYKCLEYMDTDKRMRDEADGQKPPKKLIVFLNDLPGGEMRDKNGRPVDISDIKRFEKKMQKGTKSRAITFTGTKVESIDLGDGDSLSDRLARQKDITADVGLVFGATPMELNMAGSSDTSGRNTSEAQADIYQGRGISPIVKAIEQYFTDDIIRYKYNSTAYMLEAERGQDPEQESKIDLLDLQTGKVTQNELRERENKSTFQGDQYNLPVGTSGDTMEKGSELNPMVVEDKSRR